MNTTRVYETKLDSLAMVQWQVERFELYASAEVEGGERKRLFINLFGKYRIMHGKTQVLETENPVHAVNTYNEL